MIQDRVVARHVAPPATEGFSAVRLVWMLRRRDVRAVRTVLARRAAPVRAALKRLAKMFVGSPK